MFNLMGLIGSFIAGLVCGISFVAGAADLGYSSSRGGASYINPSQLQQHIQQQNVDRKPTYVSIRRQHEAERTLGRLKERARRSFFQVDKILFDMVIGEADVKRRRAEINRDDLHKNSRYTLVDLSLHEAVQLGNTSGFTARMIYKIFWLWGAKQIIKALSSSPFHKRLDQYIDNLNDIALFIQNQDQNKQSTTPKKQPLVDVSHELDEILQTLIVQPDRVDVAKVVHLQDAQGRTLLHMALSASSLNTAKLLVQNGASLLRASHSITPLQQLQGQIKNLKAVVNEVRLQGVLLSGEEISYAGTLGNVNMVRRQNDIDMFKAHEARRLKKLKEISKILKAKAKQGSDMAQGDKAQQFVDCIQLLRGLGVKVEIK